MTHCRRLACAAAFATIVGVMVAGPSPSSAVVVAQRANVALFWTNAPTPRVIGWQTDRAGVTVGASRTSTGSYTIDLLGVTGSKGSALLTVTHDDGAALAEPICVIKSVTPTPTKTRIVVRCYEPGTGGRTDRAEFQLTYSNRNLTAPGSPSTPGFVHVTTATTAFTGIVTPLNQFRDDAGRNVRVKRTAVGRYEVRIKAESYPAEGGVALVSAVGDSVRYCNVKDWGTNGVAGSDGLITVLLHIRCYDRFGGSANSRFSAVLTLSNHFGSQSVDGAFPYAGGSQWYDAPYRQPAAPAPNYENNTSGAGNLLERAVGVDGAEGVVQYPGVYNGAATRLFSLHVTAYGDNHRCFGTGSGTGATLNDLRQYVICVDPAGTVVDGSFSASFVN